MTIQPGIHRVGPGRKIRWKRRRPSFSIFHATIPQACRQSRAQGRLVKDPPFAALHMPKVQKLREILASLSFAAPAKGDGQVRAGSGSLWQDGGGQNEAIVKPSQGRRRGSR